MINEKLSNCPVCRRIMEKGFSVKNHGLSWIPAEKMKQFIFMDKDLNEAGLRQYFPAKATYDLSYHCPNCKIYIVAYSKYLSENSRGFAFLGVRSSASYTQKSDITNFRTGSKSFSIAEANELAESF